MKNEEDFTSDLIGDVGELVNLCERVIDIFASVTSSTFDILLFSNLDLLFSFSTSSWS